MNPPHADYSRLDEVALATGLGLALLALPVMGIHDTLLAGTHVTARLAGIHVDVVLTSLTPQLRASVIALALLVLLTLALSRTARAILASLHAES